MFFQLSLIANGRSQIWADYNRTLEIEVAQRTIELSEINARLELEIEQRQQAEKMSQSGI